MYRVFRSSARLSKVGFRHASTKYKSFESFTMNSGDSSNHYPTLPPDVMPNLALIYKKTDQKKKDDAEEYLFRRLDEEFTKVTPQLIKQILTKYYRILIKAAGKLLLVFAKIYREYIFLFILYFAF